MLSRTSCSIDFGNAADFLFFCNAFRRLASRIYPSRFLTLSQPFAFSHMTPIKVNIFISHAPADKASADRLLEWMYPMRDEVNLWHYDPPKKPAELPPSWQILSIFFWEPINFIMKTFFGWKPFDLLELYNEKTKLRRENAHIYIFLTSYKSLADKQVESDIVLSSTRRIECSWGDLAPLVMPILLTPSRWKDTSRLAQFKPLVNGIELSRFPQPEEGYLLATEQIVAQAKSLQAKLNEARYFKYYPELDAKSIVPASRYCHPYLGEDPDQFEFNPPKPFRPSDWSGWAVIILIIMLSVGSFEKNSQAIYSLHLHARPAKEYQTEYPRKMPLAPPPANAEIVFPPVE